jgi:predicted enzyme related to lactoylglutathione lyase
MPTVDSYAPGTPSWVDLASTDLAGSVAFYTDLFGWQATDQGEEAGHYTMMELEGRPVAGVAPIMMEGQPPAWTTYITVTDADDSVARIEAEGGTVFVGPMDVLDVGRMAVFADPTGAACAVWQPRAHQGAALVNEPGALAWNELNTRDTAAAVVFYRAVFGWEGSAVAMGDLDYTEWKLDGKAIGGMLSMPPMVPAEVPAHWLAYVGSADCDATVATATAAGASVLVAPQDIPAGRFSVLTDPDGAVFAVIALAGD